VASLKHQVAAASCQHTVEGAMVAFFPLPPERGESFVRDVVHPAGQTPSQSI